MEHIERFGGILSSEEHDSFFTTGVIFQESGDVIDDSTDNDPAVIFFVMFGDILGAERSISSLGLFSRGLAFHHLSSNGLQSSSGARGQLSLDSQGVNSVTQIGQKLGASGSGAHSSEDNAIEERRSSESILSVDSSQNFSGAE